MKYSSIFRDQIGCADEKEVFRYLITSLNDSIRYWDYFVNWEKVSCNIQEVEIGLNILNYLIGKENIEEEFAHLLKKHPQIAQMVPVLLACRDRDFKILTDFTGGDFKYEVFSFKNKERLTDTEIASVVRFANKSGLLRIFQNKRVKNIVDYATGIEVGLDSNGRKNRGGTSMEKIVETFVRSICNNHRLDYIRQATSDRIAEKWNLKVSVDKSSRSFDFAIFTDKKLYLLETNYYGGGGSKLKSTAGEYKALFDFVSKDGHKFIWITDGVGWQTTTRPLEETFTHIEYLLNLKMVTSGLLETIIIGNL